MLGLRLYKVGLTRPRAAGACRVYSYSGVDWPGWRYSVSGACRTVAVRLHRGSSSVPRKPRRAQSGGTRNAHASGRSDDGRMRIVTKKAGHQEGAGTDTTRPLGLLVLIIFCICPDHRRGPSFLGYTTAPRRTHKARRRMYGKSCRSPNAQEAPCGARHRTNKKTDQVLVCERVCVASFCAPSQARLSRLGPMRVDGAACMADQKAWDRTLFFSGTHKTTEDGESWKGTKMRRAMVKFL